MVGRHRPSPRLGARLQLAVGHNDFGWVQPSVVDRPRNCSMASHIAASQPAALRLASMRRRSQSFIYSVFLDVAGLTWKCGWWRRRELNPRPKVFRVGIYILSLLCFFVSTDQKLAKVR